MNTTHAPHIQDAPSTETTTPTPVTIAYGDGIGPEIMEATLRILDAARAPLTYDVIEVGKSVYERGHTSGIAPEAWQTIRRNRVFLKAPITTPQGGGYKSLNVTIRKTLNLYANVRPSKSYAPFVMSLHPGMDLVIIRENEEDLYAGIEHRQTPEVAQILKLITRPGSERIIRYAFEYARAYGRRKVTCMTKDNIMKITDGLFHRVFDEVAAEYPDLEAEHQIIDIGAARVAAQPEQFDVIVTLNLYGDILSDIAAQIAGSVGLAGSANIGDEVAMFEAVHGSAPDIAGKDVANPSGLLVAATQMLVHLGLGEVAGRIKNAWLRTLEDGIHTADIYRPGLSHREVGTRQFTQAVIDRLGEQPRRLQPVQYRPGGIRVAARSHPRPEKTLVGVDAFIDWDEEGRDPNVIGGRLEAAAGTAGWRLKMITNRGVKVYPEGLPETFCTDHWRCRFLPAHDGPATFPDVLSLLKALHEAGFEVIKTEHLYTFDGERGYSLGQGE
ncbi:NADP-dependent isocitrate dehydrogenase [Rhodocaloribacter litoris]|uniref:NADP-dependent isocitrate dehydrogenase n=1 Tax=Rhodocaloribacter litoris TaxID=2558931 RepID=UPI001423BC1C|nr:NADP-dependent isocitrate dehydrogenase [Rhodocaloribacter litoris]QXD14034.1 NADP-dependent isocitrate dehydrogenase [Rhodocaloribacter litoris]